MKQTDDTKWTPGPWNRKGDHAIETEFGVYDSTGRSICTTGVFSDGREGTFEENTANAAFIALAPEMYRVLKGLGDLSARDAAAVTALLNKLEGGAQ